MPRKAKSIKMSYSNNINAVIVDLVVATNWIQIKLLFYPPVL